MISLSSIRGKAIGYIICYIFSLDNGFEILEMLLFFKYFNLMNVTGKILETYLTKAYVIFFINLYLNVSIPSALFI